MRAIYATLAVVALLGGCSKGPDGDPSATATAESSDVATGTLTAALAGAPGFSTLGTALKDTGLASVFDGKASYTVLAPTDDAFGKLGEPGKALLQPDQKAALAAVLRSHVVPGYVTREDIEAALSHNGGKPVTMPTMGSGPVTFAKAGDAITATSADGAVARLEGAQVKSGNGVAIPIDTVLKAAPGTPASKP